tara:strand:- start:246 stop:458 length:213 start_codon:yes stop_codon:yes gene_type:complete
MERTFGFIIIICKMTKRKDDEDSEETSSEDKEDFVYDEVTGGKGKKRVLDALNKTKLGKHEMDELFCEWG